MSIQRAQISVVVSRNVETMLTRALLLETSGLSGSVALVQDGFIQQATLPGDRGSAQSIAMAVKTLLQEGRLDVSQLQLIAVTSGPGSFTGLRVGLALGRAMAFASGVPLVGLSTMEVLAYSFTQYCRDDPFKPKTQKFITLLNAYSRECFVAAWTFEDAKLTRHSDDERIKLEQVSSYVKSYFSTDETLIVSPEETRFIEKLYLHATNSTIRAAPSASAMLYIAERIELASIGPIDKVLPNYLRSSAAQEKRKEFLNKADSS